jgi:tripartite-type tricarboxylate transporter receptor subunit TctC
MFKPARSCILGITLLLAAVSGADAQPYPSKPLRMVVPFPPGGSLDVVARPLANRMSELMGQQVVVDYRTGASGNIGTEAVARAPADGYTMLINTLPLVVNPTMYSKLPFDVARDLAPVSLLAAGPFVLVVHPSVPVKSVKELIALARGREIPRGARRGDRRQLAGAVRRARQVRTRPLGQGDQGGRDQA